MPRFRCARSPKRPVSSARVRQNAPLQVFVTAKMPRFASKDTPTPAFAGGDLPGVPLRQPARRDRQPVRQEHPTRIRKRPSLLGSGAESRGQQHLQTRGLVHMLTRNGAFWRTQTPGMGHFGGHANLKRGVLANVRT